MAVIVRKTEMVAIVLTAHAGTMAVIVAVAAQAAMEMSVPHVVCIGPQARQKQVAAQRHHLKIQSNVTLLAELTAATALATTEAADVKTTARGAIETLADEIVTVTAKETAVPESEILSVTVAETVLAIRIDLQSVNATETIPETANVTVSALAVSDLPPRMESTTKPDMRSVEPMKTVTEATPMDQSRKPSRRKTLTR
jgi:hypothetical protein